MSPNGPLLPEIYLEWGWEDACVVVRTLGIDDLEASPANATDPDSWTKVALEKRSGNWVSKVMLHTTCPSRNQYLSHCLGERKYGWRYYTPLIIAYKFSRHDDLVLLSMLCMLDGYWCKNLILEFILNMLHDVCISSEFKWHIKHLTWFIQKRCLI